MTSQEQERKKFEAWWGGVPECLRCSEIMGWNVWKAAISSREPAKPLDVEAIMDMISHYRRMPGSHFGFRAELAMQTVFDEIRAALAEWAQQ